MSVVVCPIGARRNILTRAAQRTITKSARATGPGALAHMRQLAEKARRTDNLDYIQSVLGQLRQMAEAERCDMLAYLVEMAYVEASDIIRGERPTRVRSSPTG